MSLLQNYAKAPLRGITLKYIINIGKFLCLGCISNKSIFQFGKNDSSDKNQVNLINNISTLPSKIFCENIALKDFLELLEIRTNQAEFMNIIIIDVIIDCKYPI